MSVSKAPRVALIATITENVAVLVRHDRFDELDSVMEATGFANNTPATTSATLGRAIVALAGVVSIDWVRSIASAAAFYRTFSDTDEANPKRWDIASRAADKAMRGVATRAVAA